MAYKTGAKRHTHRYHNIAGRWHCSLPDCTHFMPGNVAGNIIGKKSICWDCGNEFLLDEISLASDRPICPLCHSKTSSEALAKYLEEKGL